MVWSKATILSFAPSTAVPPATIIEKGSRSTSADQSDFTKGALSIVSW
ncbi:MAG: hypothetical protein ACYTFI_28270 [Planctomycetota bacterium]|jgi:hypothetical protein